MASQIARENLTPGDTASSSSASQPTNPLRALPQQRPSNRRDVHTADNDADDTTPSSLFISDAVRDEEQPSCTDGSVALVSNTSSSRRHPPGRSIHVVAGNPEPATGAEFSGTLDPSPHEAGGVESTRKKKLRKTRSSFKSKHAPDTQIVGRRIEGMELVAIVGKVAVVVAAMLVSAALRKSTTMDSFHWTSGQIGWAMAIVCVAFVLALIERQVVYKPIRSLENVLGMLAHNHSNSTRRHMSDSLMSTTLNDSTKVENPAATQQKQSNAKPPPAVQQEPPNPQRGSVSNTLASVNPTTSSSSADRHRAMMVSVTSTPLQVGHEADVAVTEGGEGAMCGPGAPRVPSDPQSIKSSQFGSDTPNVGGKTMSSFNMEISVGDSSEAVVPQQPGVALVPHDSAPELVEHSANVTMVDSVSECSSDVEAIPDRSRSQKNTTGSKKAQAAASNDALVRFNIPEENGNDTDTVTQALSTIPTTHPSIGNICRLISSIVDYSTASELPVRNVSSENVIAGGQRIAKVPSSGTVTVTVNPTLNEPPAVITLEKFPSFLVPESPVSTNAEVRQWMQSCEKRLGYQEKSDATPSVYNSVPTTGGTQSTLTRRSFATSYDTSGSVTGSVRGNTSQAGSGGLDSLAPSGTSGSTSQASEQQSITRLSATLGHYSMSHVTRRVDAEEALRVVSLFNSTIHSVADSTSGKVLYIFGDRALVGWNVTSDVQGHKLLGLKAAQMISLGIFVQTGHHCRSCLHCGPVDLFADGTVTGSTLTSLLRVDERIREEDDGTWTVNITNALLDEAYATHNVFATSLFYTRTLSADEVVVFGVCDSVPEVQTFEEYQAQEEKRNADAFAEYNKGMRLLWDKKPSEAAVQLKAAIRKGTAARDSEPLDNPPGSGVFRSSAGWRGWFDLTQQATRASDETTVDEPSTFWDVFLTKVAKQLEALERKNRVSNATVEMA